MDTKELLTKIYTVLTEKKGENICIIDISKISSLADYFVIVHGNNENQIQAMADTISERTQPVSPTNVEGYRGADWVLMDYQDIIVHIFNKESRMFYDQQQQKYVAHLYLKQGFYNYILATKSNDENLNLGEINGNFWQTQNQYQAFLYYTPFGKNYDALMGYGEIR